MRPQTKKKITRLQGINDKNNQQDIQASLKKQSFHKIPLPSYNNVTIIKKLRNWRVLIINI